MVSRPELRDMRSYDGLCDVSVFEQNGYTIKIIIDEEPGKPLPPCATLTATKAGFGMCNPPEGVEYGFVVEHDYMVVEQGWGFKTMIEAKDTAVSIADALTSEELGFDEEDDE